jgi:serine/threonine-protein kinase
LQLTKLDCHVIDEMPEEFLRSIGTVFVEFGTPTQDSGNVSYGIQIGAQRYFIKTAGKPDVSLPYLDHTTRVRLLRNAAQLSQNCRHPSLPRLYRVIESPVGPMLVYEWLDGERLGISRAQRDDPQSAFQRFCRLPAATIQRCLDTVFELHHELARAGWIAVDFYDGCLLYEFRFGRLGVVDLDMYSQGTFHNHMGRMFGSTRFMAPEEFELGALIDERTNVFVLGRTAAVFLSDGTLDENTFRGTSAVYQVVARACERERSQRYGSVAEFYSAWLTARSG